MPPFRAAQIVGARLAFFVSLVHVKDRLMQSEDVLESGLGDRRDYASGSDRSLVLRRAASSIAGAESLALCRITF